MAELLRFHPRLCWDCRHGCLNGCRIPWCTHYERGCLASLLAAAEVRARAILAEIEES